MALDSSQLGLADPTRQYEAEARQLVTSSLVHLRQYPNPQLALGGIETGSTNDVTAAMADPELAKYMGATPTGTGRQYGIANGPGGVAPNIYHFDKRAYDGNQQLRDTVFKANPGWQSFGEVPFANLGWMDTVRNADPNTVKKWQGMLSERGYYGQDHEDHQSGHWDPQKDETAFREFMIQYVLPEAMWSKSEVLRAQGSAFLSALGVEPEQLAKLRGGDQQFQRDVAVGWLQTQDPQNRTDSLHEFVDRFGIEHLPDDNWRQVAEGGSLPSKLVDTLIGFGRFALTPLMAAEHKFAGDEGTPISDFIDRGTPSIQRANELNASLSANDRSLLAEPVKKVADSQGFLPFEWWDRQKTHVALAVAYWTGDAVHGQKLENPFDLTTGMAKRIHENEDSLTGGIMGQQWVKDHPDVAQLTDLVLNTADDPTMWFGGGLIRAPKLAGDLLKAVKGGRKLTEEAQIMGAGVQGGLSTEARLALQKWMNPRKYLEQAHAAALFAKRESALDVHRLLNLDDEIMNPRLHESAERMQAAVSQVMDAKSPEEIRQVLNNDFRHVFHNQAGLVHIRTAMQSMTPEVAERVGGGWLERMRTVGGFAADGNGLYLDQPIAMSNYIEQQLHLAGVEPQKITTAVNEFFGLPQEKRGFWIAEQLPKLVEDGSALRKRGKTLADVRRAHDEMHANSYSRSIDRQLGPVQGLRQVLYAPAQEGAKDALTGAAVKPGAETSRVPRGFPEKTQQALESMDRGIKAREVEFRVFLDAQAKEILKEKPWATLDSAIQEAMGLQDVKDLRASTDQEIAQINEHAHKLAPLGRDRPGPLTTSQLSRHANFTVSNYELASYLNPGWMTAEQIAAHARLDAFYRVWKPIALMRPSTALRIAGGEDLGRGVWGLVTEFNAPAAAVRLLAEGALKSVAAAGQNVGRTVGSAALAKRLKLQGKTPMEIKVALQDRLAESKPSISDRAEQTLASSATIEAMTLARQINEVDHSTHVHWMPGQAGFEGAYANWFGVMSRAPEMREFAKAYQKGGYTAGLQAVKDQLSLKTANNAELLDTHKRDLDVFAAMQAQYFEAQMRHPEMVKWYVNGSIDRSKFSEFYKSQQDLFPVISAPRDNLEGRNFLSRALSKVPAASFHNILEPMIATSRAEVAKAMMPKYYDRLVKTYGKDGTWSEQEMRQMAQSQTFQWMRHNTYQGQRTVMGRSLRHVFPFWGATANMSRFFVRQAQLHPRLITPSLRAANQLEAQAAQKHSPVKVFGGNILQALGFSGGDMLTAEPAHAMFITSDGYGALMPGFGPIFSPLMAMVAHDQVLKDTFSQIPGLREQLAYEQGASHPLVGFAEQTLSGIGLMSPWHKPFTMPILGGDSEEYQRKIDIQARKLMADYEQGRRDHPPTQDEAASSLGAEMLTGQAVGALLPVLPKVANERDVEIRAADKEMAAAQTDEERDRVIADHQAIAPLLRYFDHRTSVQEKDQLLRDNPWMAGYTTSMYESTGPKPSTQAEYDAAIASGNLHALGVDGEYVPAIQKHQEFADAYSQYDMLQTAEATFRQRNGLSTGDPDYKTWVAQHIAPQVSALMEQYPQWSDQFLKEKRRDLPGLQASTSPLRSVATWEVIPAMAGMENDRSVAWRSALVRINDAATALQSLRADRASKEEEDQVIAGLNAELERIAATSPGFANDLRRYRAQSFDDIVNYQAMAQGQAALAAGS